MSMELLEWLPVSSSVSSTSASTSVCITNCCSLDSVDVIAGDVPEEDPGFEVGDSLE